MIYRSHDLWPFPPHPSVGAAITRSSDAQSQSEREPPPRAASANPPIRISVLDSSFNPPTLAHLALIRSLPPIASSSSSSSIASSEEGSSKASTEDYDARLLLLSVRNADKSMKLGDATYSQRLEMMIRLAHVLQYDPPPSENMSNPPNAANVAVAIIDEPTFINKSSVLRSFLLDQLSTLVGNERKNDGPSSMNSVTQDIQLTFLMGFDTLERFLATRYYAPVSGSSEDAESIMLAVLKKFFSAAPSGDGSRVVCVHRSSSSWLEILRTEATSRIGNTTAQGSSSGQSEAQEKIMALAQKFILNESISFMHISQSNATLSSSEVRARIAKALHWKNMTVHQITSFIEEQSLYRTRNSEG